MSKGRAWYKVRVRECLEGPNQDGGGSWVSGKYVKKTKTYFARSPKDAASKYRGRGEVMHVDKLGFEELHGVGDFFKLGDELLKELRKEERQKYK